MNLPATVMYDLVFYIVVAPIMVCEIKPVVKTRPVDKGSINSMAIDIAYFSHNAGVRRIGGAFVEPNSGKLPRS